MHINLSRAVLVGLAGTILASAANAQELGWSGSAQGSANALFGAAHTRLVATTFEFGRADSTLQVRSGVVLSYGDDRSPDDGRRLVTARAPKFSLGLDYRPFSRYSPFWFGSVESSLQQRLADREDVGVGGKVTFIRTPASELSVSAALLLERSRAMPSDSTRADLTTRRRWSLRFRVRHGLTPRLRFSHVSFYQPAVDHPGSYTIDTVTEMQDELWGAISATLTLHDRFDTEARGRGAPSNHDGQLLFGLRTSF
jgi:hypothetical protein